MIFPLNFKKILYYFVLIDFCPPLSCFQPPAVSFLMPAYSFISLCSFNFNTLNFTFFFHHSGCHRYLQGQQFLPFLSCNGKTGRWYSQLQFKKHNQNKHPQEQECILIGTLCTTFFIFLKTKSLLLFPRPGGNSWFSV